MSEQLTFPGHRQQLKLKRSNLKLLFEVLMQEGSKRSLHDINQLKDILLDVEQFKKLPRKSDLDYICRELALQRLKASQFVFQKERGKLYIVLQGSIGIYRRDGTQASLDVVETMSAADCFGELIDPPSNNTSNTVAISLEDSILAVLTNQAYGRFGQLQTTELSCLTESLKEFRPFRSLTETELEALALKSTLSKITSNTIVIREGELPKALFIVRKGILKLCRNVTFAQCNDSGSHTNAFSYHSKTFCVRELTAGDYLPFSGINGKSAVHYSVVSVCPCQLILISYKDVQRYSQLLQDSCLQEPSDNDIRQQYSLSREWENYKNGYISSLLPTKKRAI